MAFWLSKIRINGLCDFRWYCSLGYVCELVSIKCLGTSSIFGVWLVFKVESVSTREFAHLLEASATRILGTLVWMSAPPMIATKIDGNPTAK